jgi:hypothetical protein
MENNNWVRDLNLRNGLTTELLTEFVALWNLVATTGLLQDQEDMIRWTQTSHGHYTTSSAYKAQFKEFLPTPELASIWKVSPPPSASSTHGSFFMTVFGPLIESSGEVGTTTPFVHSADRIWKRRITCSRTVVSRAGYGTRSPSGSDCLTCSRQLGQRPRLHWSGGLLSPRDSL